jgi:sulfotransferase family protein
VPVYVVGIQRSGTTMLMEALNERPDVGLYRDSDPRAFFGFQLRSDDVIRNLVMKGNHRCVVFKPLCDSHRVVHLLEGLGTPSRGRAVWIYRGFEGRVRSTVAIWPENNLRVLRAIAEGRGADFWESGGLSPECLELIQSFDYAELSRESAAALLWYVRNALFFDLELDRRGDVLLMSYERILAEPERSMRSLCDFLSLPFDRRMAAVIDPNAPSKGPSLEIDARIRAQSVELESRLEAAVLSR